MSLVLVSLSTVTRLKLRLTPRPSARVSSDAGIAASVKAKQSMVAMSGAIMPLPLAMPLIRTSASPMRAVRVAALGKVSVVMMPRAASAQASSRRWANRPGSAAVMRSWGSFSPMVPVLASSTSAGAHPASAAAVRAVASVASHPARPVNTFALPAFTTTARARPPVSSSAARHQSTGAPGHLLRVNAPAAVLPSGTTIAVRSARAA